MSDTLEAVGSALGAVGSLFGGGAAGGALGALSGGGGPSFTSATSGAPIIAGTNINFGSGDINDTPLISQQTTTSAQQTQSQPQTAANVRPVVQPVYTAPAPIAAQAGVAGNPISSLTQGNMPLYIGGAILAIAIIYVITK